MKKIILALSALSILIVSCQSNTKPTATDDTTTTVAPTLTKIWETDTVMTTAESVLYDSKGNRLFVSLINGSPTEKDGIGGIAVIDTDGKVVNANFTQGLNAPKGMALHQDKLYVTDIDQVVIINANSGEVINKIGIDTAKFLNDLAVDNKGVVYVSDSRSGTIYTIKEGIAHEYKTGLNNVNGLNAQGDDLWVLAHNELLKVNADSSSVVATFPAEVMDGLELVDAETFVASSWQGQIFLVKRDGAVTELLNTKEQKLNTADIGYDAKNRVVYVPTFFGNTVAAYQLK